MPDIFVANQKSNINKDIPSLRKGVSLQEKVGLGLRYETVAERLLGERKQGRIKTFHILPGKSGLRIRSKERR